MTTVMDSRPVTQAPVHGVGLGLRAPHIAKILRECPAVPWFEVLAENHMADGGIIGPTLDAIRRDYPLTLHCVGMSIVAVQTRWILPIWIACAP